jgi:catechol 2,3-dioxygenase-like lactoylglutathione lyase family enzyme
MNIKGFRWVGIRTDDIEKTAHFFHDMLGLPVTRRSDEDHYAAFAFPSGQELEVFWQGSQFYDLHAHPVIAFDVEDIRAARQELEARGVEFLTDIFHATSDTMGEEFACCYFRDSNGYFYELYQQPGNDGQI